MVVGLVGERGREVREFVEDALGAAGLRAERRGGRDERRAGARAARAAHVATAIAEWFRERGGKRVLRLLDS